MQLRFPKERPAWDNYVQHLLEGLRVDFERLWRFTPPVPDEEAGIPYTGPLSPSPFCFPPCGDRSGGTIGTQIGPLCASTDICFELSGIGSNPGSGTAAALEVCSGYNGSFTAHRTAVSTPIAPYPCSNATWNGTGYSFAKSAGGVPNQGTVNLTFNGDTSAPFNLILRFINASDSSVYKQYRAVFASSAHALSQSFPISVPRDAPTGTPSGCDGWPDAIMIYDCSLTGT